jgi:polyferredoxin
LVYTALLWLLIFGVVLSLVWRMPLKVDVIRDRGLPRITGEGQIENVYRLQVMNATEEPLALQLNVTGLPGLAVSLNEDWQVGPAQSRWLAVRVDWPMDQATAGSHPIWMEVSSPDGRLHVREKAVFLVPR